MPPGSVAMSAANDKRPGWLIEVLRTAVTAAISAALAIAGAVWQARGVVAEYDKRLTVVEESHARLVREAVPRDEQKAHWDATERGIADLKQDVRELRQDIVSRRGIAQQP